MGKVIIENQLLSKAPLPKKNDQPSEIGKALSSRSRDNTVSSAEGRRTFTSSQSNLSSLSESTDGSSYGSSYSTDDDIEFDNELRGKHRAACKNMSSGKFSRAIKTFEEILADLLDRYGEEHDRVGAALHNVAVANLRAGHLKDARDAIEEAVRIRQVTLGRKNSKVAVSTDGRI